MKRSILVLALLAVMATGAFAAGFSLALGGGGLFDWSLIGNGMKGSINYEGLGGNFDASMKNLSVGGFLFFDATYAELDASFAYGMITGKADGTGVWADLGNIVAGLDNSKGTQLQLGFSLLGKFPIGSGSFVFFPLLGADYNLVLSYKSGGETQKNPGDISQIGFLGGVGFDINFSKLFLRTEAMFHLRLPNKIVKDAATAMGSSGIYTTDTTFGMGPRVKLGLGYRFGGGSGSSSSSSSRSGRYMLVNTDTLNVRSGPSADNSLVGTLPRGTRVEVLDRSGTWWKIKSGKIQGYVNSSYLKTE